MNRRLKIKLNENLLIYLGLLYIIFLFSILSSFWSGEQLLSIQRALLAYFTAFTMLLLVNSVNDFEDTFIFVSKIIIYSSIILAILSFILYYMGDFYYIDGKRYYGLNFGTLDLKQRVSGLEPFIRLSSLTPNANVFGRYLAISLILALGLFKMKKMRPLFFYVIFIFLNTALIHTFSRTSVLMVVIAFSIFFLINNKDRIKTLFLFGFGSVVLMLFAIRFDLLTIISSLETDRLDIGLTGRENSWAALLNSIKESPIIGTGFAVNNEVVLVDLSSAHNVYLSVIADIGMIGFFMFLLIIIFAMYISLRLVNNLGHYNENQKVIVTILLSIFYSITIHQLFESNILYFDFMNYLWVFTIVGMILLDNFRCNNYKI